MGITIDDHDRTRIRGLGLPDPGNPESDQARRRRRSATCTVIYALAGEVCTKPGENLYTMLEGIKIPRGWSKDPAAWVRKLTTFVETARPGDMIKCHEAVIVRERPNSGGPL